MEIAEDTKKPEVAGAIATEKKCTKGRKISLYFEFINWNMSALGNVHH